MRSNDGYPFDQQMIPYLGIAGAELDPGRCCFELGLTRSAHAVS